MTSQKVKAYVEALDRYVPTLDEDGDAALDALDARWCELTKSERIAVERRLYRRASRRPRVWGVKRYVYPVYLVLSVVGMAVNVYYGSYLDVFLLAVTLGFVTHSYARDRGVVD